MANYKEVETLLKEYENTLLNFHYNRFYIGNEIQKGKLFEIMNSHDIYFNPDTIVGLVDATDKFLFITTDAIYSDSFCFYYDFIEEVKCEKKAKNQKNSEVIFSYKDYSAEKYLNFKFETSQVLTNYFNDDVIVEFINKLLKSHNKEVDNRVYINFCSSEEILNVIPWANDSLAKEICDTRTEHGTFKDFYDFFKTMKMNIKPLLHKYFDFGAKPKPKETVESHSINDELQRKIDKDKEQDEKLNQILNNPALYSGNRESDDAFSKVKKLKELLDIGAITLEEFNRKKKELLKL